MRGREGVCERERTREREENRERERTSERERARERERKREREREKERERARFVRHDVTSEGEYHVVSEFPTTFDLPTLFAVATSLNLPNCKTKRKNTVWHSCNLFFCDVGTLSGFVTVQKLRLSRGKG